MARDRKKKAPRRGPSAFDRARDELFSAIRQCGVMEAAESERVDWMNETVAYMKERYPELGAAELRQLQETGMRFCQPVIPHGKEHTALSTEGVNAA